MADAADAAAAAASPPPLRRSRRGVAKVDYAEVEARGESPTPPEAPPAKRAKRAASRSAAAAPGAQQHHAGAAAAASAPPPPRSPDAHSADLDAAELAEVPDGARITLSRATGEEFCLTKAQLEAAKLAYDELPNPHAKSSGAPMRLYDQREVLALALRLYGGRAGLEARRGARAARSGRVAEGRAACAKERRAELAAALAAQGLALRGDSWLCEQYLKHGATSEWPLAAVVRRLGQMRYLHEHTAYARILQRVRSEYRQYGERWDAQETAEEAEAQALPRGGYPAVWPWLAAAKDAAGDQAAGAGGA